MSNDTIDLLTLDDAAFGALYAQRIAPILRDGEIDQAVAMRAYVFRCLVGGAAAGAVAAVAYALFPNAWVALILAGVTFTAIHWYADEPLHEVGAAMKQSSLEAIANAIGCEFNPGVLAHEALSGFMDLQLLPFHDRSMCEDCFEGDHHGCAFAFYEGHLENYVRTRSGGYWRTVFRGQLIRVAFPKKFHGTTIIRRDLGLFNFLRRWSTSLQRVGLGDSRLERAFEVYSNDQVEARYLIHPVFMERLIALETQFKGKRLRAAFVEGDLLIAIEGGDKFEIGSMFSRLDDIERARVIVKDVMEIMRVIDAVLTAEQGALPPT